MQHGETLFAVVFAYDAAGKPTSEKKFWPSGDPMMQIVVMAVAPRAVSRRRAIA